MEKTLKTQCFLYPSREIIVWYVMVGYDLEYESRSGSGGSPAVLERLNEISSRLQRLESRVERLESRV
jgi:hypothetical protein